MVSSVMIHPAYLPACPHEHLVVGQGMSIHLSCHDHFKNVAILHNSESTFCITKKVDQMVGPAQFQIKQLCSMEWQPLHRHWGWWQKLHMLQGTTRSLQDVLWQRSTWYVPTLNAHTYALIFTGEFITTEVLLHSPRTQELLRNHLVPFYWIGLLVNSMVLGHMSHPILYEWHHIAQQLVYNYINVYNSNCEGKLGHCSPLMHHSIYFDGHPLMMSKVQNLVLGNI